MMVVCGVYFRRPGGRLYHDNSHHESTGVTDAFLHLLSFAVSHPQDAPVQVINKQSMSYLSFLRFNKYQELITSSTLSLMIQVTTMMIIIHCWQCVRCYYHRSFLYHVFVILTTVFIFVVVVVVEFSSSKSQLPKSYRKKLNV